jgi:hypothetical protein
MGPESSTTGTKTVVSICFFIKKKKKEAQIVKEK